MTAGPGLCGCGCGAATSLAVRTRRRDGLVAGEPLRFIHGHNQRLARRDGGHLPPPAPEVYAEALRAVSEQLIGAVHDEGSAEVRIHIARALAMQTPHGVDPVEALAVVLAAQVDPDAPTSRRLGWVEALSADIGRTG